MKSLIVIAVLMVTSSVYAQEDIATAKSEMSAHLDKRIANLQEAKTCVSGAQSKEDLKKCHHALKEDHMEIKHERLNKREARLKEKLQKVEEQKAK